MELSDYQRTRARQVCDLIGAHREGPACSDPETPCNNETCYVFELLHLGEAAGIDRAIKICGENDSAERAANDLRDYRTNSNGEP